jgi:hypothetical protein
LIGTLEGSSVERSIFGKAMVRCVQATKDGWSVGVLPEGKSVIIEIHLQEVGRTWVTAEGKVITWHSSECRQGFIEEPKLKQRSA